jgi:DNA-binding response OmpR family regulator
MARILVIEDDAAIADAVAARLRAEGLDVTVAGDGPSGVDAAARLAPDLVVLDWMLPGFDGVEACRRIQADRHVPVLFLTARDAETDVLVGLGVGADDYVTKPFSVRELVARVHAILRRAARAGAGEDAPLAFGPFVLDRAARRLLRDGEPVALTPTELDLLAELAARPGRAFTRAELLDRVWDWRDGGSTRTVDSHVAALRRKAGSQVVRTVSGHGYALGDFA